jgi:hypothetical protein
MNRGRVYVWTPDPAHPLGGRVAREIVALPRLDPPTDGIVKLRGKHVLIRNGGEVNAPDPITGKPRAVPIGDAIPDPNGDFLFEPGRGGGRIDKVDLAESDFRERYIQASHFGEVNSYYHIDMIASYVGGLLEDLAADPLPRVVTVINAHHAATGRDGVIRKGILRPFEGGHYRLPSRRYDIHEHHRLHPDGEIHIGPGRFLTDHGALVEAAGDRYRTNASHNAGILYHEYGHHITNHTADFRGNSLRRADRKNNRKTAMDEGTCDYFTAVMLGTPHIWALHRRHDAIETHRRSLVSKKTMNDFDPAPTADPHANGTIWGAALWDLRSRLVEKEGIEGGRYADMLVLKALILMGRLGLDRPEPTVASLRHARERFGAGLSALLVADEILDAARHYRTIESVFAARGVQAESACFEGLSLKAGR